MKEIYRYLAISCILLLFPLAVFAQYDKNIFLLRGQIALSDSKYALALESFNVLHRLDSTDYMNLFYRGIAKYNLGDMRGAGLDFEAAIRYNPVFAQAYHYKGIIESRFEQYDKALESIQKAISLRPDQSSVYYNRALAYLLSQQFEKADKDFTFYLRRDKTNYSAYLNRATVKLYLKDTLAAYKDFNLAIKYNLKDPDPYIRRASLFMSQNKYDEALSDMNKALSLDTTYTLSYFNRAILYFQLERYNEALADFNSLIKYEPTNALALYNRSLLYARVGLFDKALDDMSEVLKINPKNVLAYFNRASYYVNMEYWNYALEDYNKAISLYPDFVRAYLNRSYVENLLGLKKKSKEDYLLAHRKIEELKTKSKKEDFLADTSKTFNSLLALDADFAKKDFRNGDLMQNKDLDIRLRPLFRFVLAKERQRPINHLSTEYDNKSMAAFIASVESPIRLSSKQELDILPNKVADEHNTSSATALGMFELALYKVYNKKFNQALSSYDEALKLSSNNIITSYIHMNRAVLKADMIEFLSSMTASMPVLSIDNNSTTNSKIAPRSIVSYDYSEAIEEMQEAVKLNKNAYFYYNLANLYALSSRFVEALDTYAKAIELYPYMSEAYFNRALILIYLKDVDKAYYELSRAGELGLNEAYAVIKKYLKN